MIIVAGCGYLAGIPSGHPVVLLAAVGGAAVPGVAGVVWLRRRGLRNWSRWTLSALGFGLLQVAVGVGAGLGADVMVGGPGLSAALLVPGGLGLSLAAALTAGFASKRMLRPLVPELGAIDQEVLLARQTAFLTDFIPRLGRVRQVTTVAMADRIQVLHIDGNTQLDRTTESIPYTEIAAAHPITLTADHRAHPWFISASGYPWYPTGDRAIRINTGHRATNLLIPTTDADVIADIINTRVRRAKQVRR
ncbi:hypothetical protein ACFVVM_28825 [Nocardia sp. NPDC058176]|uniref:hypothetical protein n=1 Tax=Nocardia sp. NPDC058176 TaxID=3346368 RepID=UPI0036D85410